MFAGANGAAEYMDVSIVPICTLAVVVVSFD
jgi:hypothetical protein